jgi:AraC-like DNA-binding protein
MTYQLATLTGTPSRQMLDHVEDSGGATEDRPKHILIEKRPSPALAHLVSTVYFKQLAPGQLEHSDFAIPAGSVELSCRIGSFPVVIGPRSGPESQVLAPGPGEVGIRFRAGAASAVFGVPMSELADCTVPADELLGAAAYRVAELIAESSGPAVALAQLQQLVADRTADAPGEDPVIRELVVQLMPGRAGNLAALPSQLGISERHLRRRCHTAVGLTPKVLHRMMRFQGFLARGHQLVDHGRPPRGYDLARLAVEAGYVDQSHLTRECVRLSGQSPAALLAEIAQDCIGHDHGAWYGGLFEPTVAPHANR